MKYLLAVFAVLTLSLTLAAQDMGRPVLQTFRELSPFESMNLSNGNILLHAPVMSRGGPMPFEFTLSQNVISLPGCSGINCSNPAWQAYIGNGVTGYIAGYGVGPLGYGSNYNQRGLYYQQTDNALCPDGVTPTNKIVYLGIVDSFGANHGLAAGAPPPGWDSMHCIYAAENSGSTYDLSGLVVDVPATSPATPAVYDNSGVFASAANIGVLSDPHGNTITVAEGATAPHTVTYTGQLSASPLISYPDPFLGALGATTDFTYKDAAGANRSVEVTYYTGGQYGTNFSCPGWGNAQPISLDPVKKIAWSDGSSLNVSWETTGSGTYTGRMSTVTLPTGGVATYGYSGGTTGQGWWCSAFPGTSPNYVFPATITRTIGGGTWTFALVPDSNYNTTHHIVTTETKPDGAKTVYEFVYGLVTLKTSYDTNGTTQLSQEKTCYNSTLSNCALPTAFLNTIVSVYHYVPGVANPSGVVTTFDYYGNPTEVDNYDFGPTLINKTVTTYGSWNGSACVSMAAVHITNKPCEVNTQNASSTVLSRTRYKYNTTTGDLLNEYDYTGATTFLTKTYTYNTNGTVASMTRVDGVPVTFGYSQCNGFLPDHATNAVGTASMTWDCNGVVPKTTTDLNGLTVTTTYGDPLFRVTQVSDNGGQAPVTYSYTPTSSTETMTFNGGNSVETTVNTANSLGQLQEVQHRQGPVAAHYDTVSFGYDTTGHTVSISQPCSANIGTVCPTTAIAKTYDGLSRTKTETTQTATPGVNTYTYPTGDIKIVSTPAPTGENAKTVQIEKNGLGWTTRVCAVITSGLSGGGSCGERTAASGYLTTYTRDPLGRPTLISRNAQGTAVNTSASYDMLSRVTQSTVPESGTWNFYYDTTGPGCSGHSVTNGGGKLTETKDAALNVNCNIYESAGRLSNIYPTSGPNSASTPMTYFCYDHQCGSALSNTLGRLWATGTTFPPYNVITAQQHFDYDIYGRKADFWQTSAGLAGSFFQTTASYADNGALVSLGGIPGVSDFTFGLDGEGRHTSAASGATTIVSSVAYDAASSPLTITYGSGDTDNYLWDPNTRNMTQYQFKLGAANTTDTGVLTWNANGTLKTLAITDNITSADTQTCNTAYDDLVRITSYNCGALWNETYAYSPDYAGNVTKSGSLSFSPGYVAANNRMMAPYTYNANGNLLNDSTLGIAYTWDAYGGMLSAGSTSTINDSSGNMVESTVAGTKTYYVYSPIGLIGSASNLTTGVSIKMPLPGGAFTTYGSPGTQYIYHQDHTGSGRLISNFLARTLWGVMCYGPMGELYCGTPASSEYEGSSQWTAIGLDDFDATRYSGAQGRTISPTGGVNGYSVNNSPF